MIYKKLMIIKSNIFMQKLRERNTYAPTDITQVRSNCEQPLKALRRGSGVSALKTSFNNPDASLTDGQAEKNLRVSSVFVLNMRGKPLMPCSLRKAKMLLKNKKAKVVNRTPFAIQLLYATGETNQKAPLGCDPGYKHVGLSVVTEKKELFRVDASLRDDMVKLLSEKRTYRRSRRGRKTWYRKPRFLNRGIPKGWLAPSIQNKVDTTVKIINFARKFIPVSEINIEVGAFDIQKIKNPEIDGIDYQNGEQKDFWNTREYVLYRDDHKCQACKGKSGDKYLDVHHIISRQIGGDRPDNLITLCETCHDKHHQNIAKLKFKISKGFKAEAFMNIVRWRIVEELKKTGILVKTTYGYITKSKRIENKIPKSHDNDAFVIAGGTNQQRANIYSIKQVRRSNRKLFKGARSHIKNTAQRFIQGFQRYDKVLYKGKECFIFGRRVRGAFDIRKLDGTKINTDAKVKELKLLETFKTLLITRELEIAC